MPPLLSAVDLPACFEGCLRPCWLVSECLWSGLCAPWGAGTCIEIALGASGDVECGSRFRGARGVLSAPFLKVKGSLGAPDLEEHSLDKQASSPAIPGVL